GEIRSLASEGIAPFFTAYGYAVACADMRGTGASSGWLMDFMPRIAMDGKNVVDWMAAQDWCDGNVGMMGGSYLGWSQTAVASQRPEALKCIMPTVIPLEGYTGEVYPGGIYLQGFLNLWSGFMFQRQRNYFVPDGPLPTKPVVDEDGDGDLADEIPLDLDGDGDFLDEPYPPKYSDGQEREHIYYHATKPHLKDYDYSDWAKDQSFIDSKSPLGYTLYDLGPNAHVPALMESGIPIYHVGGWFDGFTRGTFELYCTMKETNPSKVLMTPGYHSISEGPFWDFLGEDPKAFEQQLLLEHLRFFDRYLKEIDNGIDREPPITLYTMGGQGWRQVEEWPLEQTTEQILHLNEANRLTRELSETGSDNYQVDFHHSSTYSENEGNRFVGIGGQHPHNLPFRTEKDVHCLIYETDPLTGDLEVTGHPIVELFVSSTESDGDFFVYLEDVGETGEALLITEGCLRAGFAELVDNDEIIFSGTAGIDVLPDLPWHGYEEAQYNDDILDGSRVVSLEFDLFPTSWVFKAGHRIRLSIAGSDYPTFRLHPKLSPSNDPNASDNKHPVVTVLYSADHPSVLRLPVME
ncbi:MAG: CocE/NonD family hydrolase, partial [Candidatus Omnitrophica bacterium]|nr:CocE/NonD family hydrolase [Candidatus Omnitrophota bacterium]